jgi:hypothetical protein
MTNQRADRWYWSLALVLSLARTIHEFQHDRRFGPLMAAMRRPAGPCACG